MKVTERFGTIGAELSAIARSHPDKEAVVDPFRRLTFAELDARTDAIAGGLHALGLNAGDPVLLQVGNRVETVEVLVRDHQGRRPAGLHSPRARPPRAGGDRKRCRCTRAPSRCRRWRRAAPDIGRRPPPSRALPPPHSHAPVADLGRETPTWHSWLRSPSRRQLDRGRTRTRSL